MSSDVTDGGGVSRLSFLKAGAGVAAGAAAIGIPAAAALGPPLDGFDTPSSPTST